MGKLNIAHHKSYHPYRRDNIERVRKDEEEARLKEAQEEGRMMLADSEARIDLLRSRAGLNEGSRNKQKPEKIEPSTQVESASANQITAGPSGQGAVLPTTNGHINLFQDIEKGMIDAIRTTKKADPKATEEGFKLGPEEKDLKRWYTRRKGVDDEEKEEKDIEKGQRDEIRKQKHDPLVAIERRLATPSEATSSKPTPNSRSSRPLATTVSTSSSDPSVQARLNRESSERERALALKRRKQKEIDGNMTPSTVYNGDVGEGYGDVYNRQDVEAAHRGRERGERYRDRGWGDGHSRRRRREW